ALAPTTSLAADACGLGGTKGRLRADHCERSPAYRPCVPYPWDGTTSKRRRAQLCHSRPLHDQSAIDHAGLPHGAGVRSAASPGSDDTALSAAVSAGQEGDEDAFRLVE